MFDMSMRPGASAWPPGSTPGRTFRFYAGQNTLLPFAFGLGYSRLTYSVEVAGAGAGAGAGGAAAPTAHLLRAARDFVAAHAARRSAPLQSLPLLTYTVRVANEGPVDTDEVVLGFVVPPGAGAGGLPLRELFAFERVHVRAGEAVAVALTLSARDLVFLDARGARFAPSGAYRVEFGVREGGAFVERALEVWEGGA
jgi:hypothetical protein